MVLHRSPLSMALAVLFAASTVPAMAAGPLDGASVVWTQKHTQFPGPGRTENNVVGVRVRETEVEGNGVHEPFVPIEDLLPGALITATASVQQRMIRFHRVPERPLVRTPEGYPGVRPCRG